MSFTDKYPLEPPEILFLEPSPVHPHIYSNGHVCLDILYDGRNGGWSPALTINKVVMSLRSMLASNQDKVRHPPKFSVPSPGSFRSGSVTLIGYCVCAEATAGRRGILPTDSGTVAEGHAVELR